MDDDARARLRALTEQTIGEIQAVFNQTRARVEAIRLKAEAEIDELRCKRFGSEGAFLRRGR